jgi:hypothetical protein
MINTVLKNPITVSILGIMGIVVPIVIAIIQSRLSQKLKLYYRISGYRWYIIHKKKYICLNLVLWNAGLLPIRASDVGDAIKVLSNEKIKSAKVFYCTKPSNNICIKINRDYPLNKDHPAEAEVTFNYLNSGDGVVFQIVSPCDSNPNIYVKGDIIGGKGQFSLPESSSLSMVIVFLILLLFSWLIFYVGYVSQSAILSLVLMTIGVAFYPFSLWPVYRLIKRRKMPRKIFEQFNTLPDLLPIDKK